MVLLSVVDHYNRVAKDTKKRVVGVLLGEVWKGQVDVTNSFALPFEEDDNDTNIWFLDHSYLDVMFKMFKKVNGECGLFLGHFQHKGQVPRHSVAMGLHSTECSMVTVLPGCKAALLLGTAAVTYFQPGTYMVAGHAVTVHVVCVTYRIL